ncbi:MAG: hypothetical protein AAFR98_02355, partial [Pseudomonadota bacterium]
LDFIDDPIDHKAVATIRDPVTSFLSGTRSGFLNLFQEDFGFYCERVEAFYQYYSSIGAHFEKYEDIVTNPEAFFERMSQLLGIEFPDNFRELIEDSKFSGGSGRKGSDLMLRPVRDEDKERYEELKRDETYQRVASLLGY